MRVRDVALGVVVDSDDPGALYALAVLLLDELASSMHHSEVDGASIIDRLRWTLVEPATHAGWLSEIHTVSL